MSSLGVEIFIVLNCMMLKWDVAFFSQRKNTSLVNNALETRLNNRLNRSPSCMPVRGILAMLYNLFRSSCFFIGADEVFVKKWQ